MNLRDRLVHFQTKWLTLIGEHLQDDQGTVYEYWRIEKADSVIVLPRYHQSILLPPPTYRPGIGQSTLDLPGGRADRPPAAAALAILERELQIPTTAIARMMPLNPAGWWVNSSFSNQKLYGWVAEIAPDWPLPTSIRTHPTAAYEALVAEIHCLQCRMVLREARAQGYL
ncbi:MAG: NUDIX hydrolase [Oscillatoriales cyanobacterium SM2_1_8]|nr:NUDIX hydrolase [Oscillatoriales cyanobacterium SM2_1_8]